MLSKTTKILLISSNIWYLGEGLLGPLLAVFTERIGGSILDVSWAYATYLVVTGIVVIFVGRVSDKIGQEVLMVVGYALTAVLTFAYLFVSSPLHLFVVQAGLGLAVALSGPTWNALYSKNMDRKNAGFTWGYPTGQLVYYLALPL